MSENQLMNSKNPPKQEEEQAIYESVLGVYEANLVNEQLREQKLREFYTSLEFPCCGDYLEPRLTTIADKKKQMGKEFISNEKEQIVKISPYDGLFEHREVEGDVSRNQLIRQKTRFIRDGREEYFQQNGDFVSEEEFFHNQLSRLANISFEQNYAIRTFQKNAILSQRNNQKKSLPFELEINIGCLWITRHSLQNEEQRRFQQLRPLMKDYSMMSSYPILPQYDKQIKYLMKIKQKMLQMDATTQQKQQIESKIQIATNLYTKQVDKIKTLMLAILDKWKQVKQARRNSGMQTVPWKLNVKEYQIDGQKSYDFGMTQMELNPVANNVENNRREDIRKERYMVKIYINGYQVAKSQKIHLTWPSFRVPINQKFNVTVYSAPSSIQIEVIKLGIINQTIDTINLALPGVNSKTITASEQRYAGALFSLNGPKFRKGEEEVEPPSGMVIYRIQWKGEGSRMPPVSFKAQEEETAPTEGTQEEIDYQQLYDIKDPRIPHKQRKQEQDGDFPKGYGALLPFADIQSARHLLLKLKATHPEFQSLEIPLLQEQIRKRQDLISIIETQKIRSLQHITVDHEQIYNPSQGFFKTQDDEILQEIRQILFKVQGVKVDANKGGNKVRYKITEQIINQFIFQQMQSPIVIFCKDLFTQKRKLGPKVTYYQQARAVFDDMEVNLHLRSARNMPIRESSFAQIRNFQEEQARMNPMARFQQMAGNTGNANMYGNYAGGMFQRQVNMQMQGQNFFIPGMINEGRQPLEASYQKKSLERNNTYIELRFKKMLKRTQCFEGPFPQWNQTIDFAYNFKNQGMTLDKLFANNEKMMKLLIFDMTEQSKPTTAIAEARIKKTKYFLGRIDIPMSLLVAIPSITGVFRVQRPLLIFGYGIKKAGLFDFEPDLEEANKTQFPDIHTFLNLDLFSDPLIDNMIAYNIDRKYVSGENQSTLLLQRASDWLAELNTKRYIRMWLNNVEGKSIFICRWLSNDISPPPQLGNQNLIERCARFVAMIPKKFTCKLLQNTQDFHFTCDQFINVKMGQDHGILLCNYFNFIDRKSGRDYIQSYLAIGKAFPYGKSIYVLRRNTRTNDCELWDPYEGECFFIPVKQYQNFCCFFRFAKKKAPQTKKDMCSMLELGCLVSIDNIYVNIQEELKPTQLDFQLQNEKLWKPFFNERTRGQYFDRGIIESIQHVINEQDYPKTKGIQSQLQNRLYDYLRGNLQTQRRKHFKPYTFKVNTNISNVIRNKILYSCETFRMDHRISGGDSTLYSEHSHDQKIRFSKALQELEQEKNRIKGQIDADKLLYGFTINVPYTSDRDVWERIQQAHLHLNQTENIQFVLSIRCFELACHVISVWVFIGSIA